MAYFGAIGYILEESGGPQILTDTGVLAPGSLNGFISGKHFNRYKRLHTILAAAFRVLSFRSFLKQSGSNPVQVSQPLDELKNEPSQDLLQKLETSHECITLMEQWAIHRRNQAGQTRSDRSILDGVHRFSGALLFSRACRTNDLELYIHCLGRMCSIFFATSRPNYSRWMVRYHLNLLNIDTTHPGIRETWKMEAFQ